MQSFFSFIFLIFLLVPSCDKKHKFDLPNPAHSGDDLTSIPHNPHPYDLKKPEFFPTMPIPADNPMTVEGVKLGRYLFYDPILSSDSTQSCSSCHIQKFGFSDGKALSTGVAGKQGRRSAMALVNVGYLSNGLFWDGRVSTLEEQLLQPVADPLEMNENWDHVEEKLRRHAVYPRMFREAFPIENTQEITRKLVAKVIAQFERTLVSANSRYDKAVSSNSNGFKLRKQELDGYFLFFLDIATNHPGCHHCHNSRTFGMDEYFNNGLEAVQTLNDFPDKGRGAVTGYIRDNGKFRAPTLRNISLTAPYMHDGRFKTLDEVLDHYISGGHYAQNRDANVSGFKMTAQERESLIAFLTALTDTSFVNNPAFRSPFVKQ